MIDFILNLAINHTKFYRCKKDGNCAINCVKNNAREL